MGVVPTTEHYLNLGKALDEIPSLPPFDEDELIPVQLSFVVTHVSNFKT